MFQYANLVKISEMLMFLFGISVNIFSQNISATDKMLKMKEPAYVYDDYVFSKSIKTVKLMKSGMENTSPVIILETDNSLELNFDDINTSARKFCYSILHCNADWTASSLFSTEFADGFNENQITDYTFSTNTLISYIHYRLVFPNFDIKPKVSGNYVLMVYLNYNRDSIVFTRRFFVVEPLVSIDASIKRAGLVDLQKCCQEIDFTINKEGINILDPYFDVKVNIEQNGRFDNRITGLKPKYVKDQEMVYDYENENVFGGGVEFREFDTRSLKYQGINVNQIAILDSTYHIGICMDDPRSFKKYNYSKDMNGRYVVRSENNPDYNIGAEYAWVYFTLKSPFELLNDKIFVFGEMSNWNFSEENQMVYNIEKKVYELKMLIKQGYYNYIYVTTSQKLHANVHDFEGSHYETENEYVIYVYIRDRDYGYERLVGIKSVSS